MTRFGSLAALSGAVGTVVVVGLVIRFASEEVPGATRIRTYPPSAPAMLRVAENIDDPVERCRTLRNLGAILVKHDRGEALRAFKRARTVATTLDSRRRRERAVKGVVRKMTEIGLTAAAREEADRLNDSGMRAMALATIRRSDEAAEASAGLLADARDAAEDASVPARKVRGLCAVGEVARVLGRSEVAADVLRDAREATTRVKEPVTRARLQVSVAEQLRPVAPDAAAEVLKRAADIVNASAEPRRRSRLCLKLGEALMRLGLRERALDLFRPVVAALKKANTAGVPYSLTMQKKIITIFSRVGLFDRARELIETMSDSGVKAAAQRILVTRLAGIGRIERAFDLAVRIQQPWMEQRALRAIVDAARKQGRVERVGDFVDETDAVCVKAGLVNGALTGPAGGRTAAAAERLDAAVKEVVRAAEDARSWGRLDRRHRTAAVGVLREVGRGLAEIGKSSTAANLFAVVRKRGRTMPRREGAPALRELAGTLRQLGRPEKANSLLEDASRVAGHIRSAAARTIVLSDIARRMAAAGRDAAASRVFEEALTAAERVGKVGRSQHVYKAVTLDLVAAGRRARAKELAPRVENPVARIQAMLALAKGQPDGVGGGRVNRFYRKAWSTLRQVPSIARDNSTLPIVKAMADSGRLEKALGLVRSMERAPFKAKGLLDVAAEASRRRGPPRPGERG